MIAHVNLSATFYKLERFDAASAQAREALTLDPRNGDALVNLALAQKASGQQGDAQGSLRRALELNPRSAAAHYNLGSSVRGWRRSRARARSLSAVPAVRWSRAVRLRRGCPAAAPRFVGENPLSRYRPHNMSEIDALLKEDRRFPPSEAWTRAAIVSDSAVYERAAADPESFWAEFARELEWIEPWSQVLEWTSPDAKWFLGGKLNASVNCLDRHIRGPRRNKAAFIWEGEPAIAARSPTGISTARSTRLPTFSSRSA